MAVNGQKGSTAVESEVFENVLELDYNELANALSLPELRTELANTITALGELFAYMQAIDARLQALLGEPVVNGRITHTTPPERLPQMIADKPKDPKELLRGLVAK